MVPVDNTNTNNIVDTGPLLSASSTYISNRLIIVIMMNGDMEVPNIKYPTTSDFVFDTDMPMRTISTSTRIIPINDWMICHMKINEYFTQDGRHFRSISSRPKLTRIQIESWYVICKTHVVIDGNIASGKSTLIEKLPGIVDGVVKTVVEPVDVWNTYQHEGIPILTLYGSEPKEYSYLFQTVVLTSKIDYYSTLGVTSDMVVASERSIHADKDVFSRRRHDLGHMTDMQWKLYCAQFNLFSRNVKCEMNPFVADVFIYLDVSPKICYERMKKRNRPGEENHPLELLENFGAYYEKFIGDLKTRQTVEVIDGTLDQDVIVEKVSDIIRRARRSQIN